MKGGGRPGGRVAVCLACLSLLLSSAPPGWLSAPVSVAALSCLPCERSRCDHNLRCPGHTVTAPCGCCEECARQLGEPCGGAFGIVGQCDLGLRCLVASSPTPPPPPPGESVDAANASSSSSSSSLDPAAARNWDGDEVGICKAAEEDYADDVEYLAMEPCLEEHLTGCNLRAGQCVCEEARTCSNPFSFASLDACAQALRRIEDEKPDCSGVRCVVQFSPRCPDDSVLIEGFAPPGLCCPLPSRCECRPAGCVRRACPSSSQATLVRKATGRPGECCNIYDCKRTFDSDCRGVECPPVLDVSCPPDSQPTPGKLTGDGCCVQPDSLRCVCGGPTECSKPECEAGTVARLLIRGDGTPGQCCDVYECVKGTGRTCSFSGVELADGETYRLDACRFCRCRAGVSFCFAAQCGELRCPRYYTPPGECCPVCEDPMTALSNPAGCFAAGEIRAHGARWREDDCTFCRCVDGEPQCTATACGQSCLHPVKIPGECCPVCEEPTLITAVPPVCRAVGNCSLRDSDCSHGFRLDAHACRLCQCKTKAEACAGLMEGCTLDCPFGFALDDVSGCETCQCRTKARKCRPATCDKHCPYGYMTNKQGCEACRCMKCPPFTCTKQCLFGFQQNSKGCQVCKCKESPVLPSPTLPPLRPGSCLLMDGHRRADGEAWHDGCRECYCHSGREMCSLIACPAPACTSPTLKPGRCCPSCHDGGDEEEADPSEAAVCHSPGGQSYVEGETWPMDACTQCACHGGRVLCDSEVCPPLLCASPARTPDSCCPHCPDGEGEPGGAAAGNDSMLAYCRSDEGDMFLPWEAWKPDVCTSCVCRNGHIACFHESCPALPCSRPVLRKGQCCSYCLDEPPFSAGCSFDGRLYGDGERWALDSCTHCFCVGSQTLCAMDDCPTLTCAQPLFLEGLCCPLCPDEPTVRGVTVPVIKADRWNEIELDNPATLSTAPALEEADDLENHILGAHLRLPVTNSSHGSRSQDLAWLALVPLVAIVAIGAALLYQHRHKRWIPSPAYKPPSKESCFSPELQTHSVVYVDCERGTKVQVDSPHRMKRLANEDVRHSGCFSVANGRSGGSGTAQAGAQRTDDL